jgi:hypothetical protein
MTTTTPPHTGQTKDSQSPAAGFIRRNAAQLTSLAGIVLLSSALVAAGIYFQDLDDARARKTTVVGIHDQAPTTPSGPPLDCAVPDAHCF